MTIKELIEYLQQEVIDGMSETEEVSRMHLNLVNKRLMVTPRATRLFERGQDTIEAPRGMSLVDAIKEHKKPKEPKEPKEPQVG